MDWGGIMQGMGNFGDILSGKKSYNDVKLGNAELMDRRAKTAMDAHNVARAEQYDLDKERMRAAREWDLQKYITGAANDREAGRQQFEAGQNTQSYINNTMRDAANNQARYQQAQLRAAVPNRMNQPLNPAWRALLGPNIPEDATFGEAQAFAPVIAATQKLESEQKAADAFEALRKARREEAARNTLGAKVKRFFGYGEAPATGTTNAPAGDNY